MCESTHSCYVLRGKFSLRLVMTFLIFSIYPPLKLNAFDTTGSTNVPQTCRVHRQHEVFIRDQHQRAKKHITILCDSISLFCVVRTSSGFKLSNF